MNNRLDYIDKLRGFAIFLVVLGHIYLPHTVQGGLHPIAEMIYSFHMQLFFFISGYLCETTHRIETKGYWAFLKEKGTALLISYLFWVIAISFIFTDNKVNSVTTFINLFQFFPNKLYWFMPVLFLFMFLYALQHWLICKNSTTKNQLLLIILTCGIFVVLGIVFHSYFMLIYTTYIFSFFFGCMVMRNEKLKKAIMSKKVFGGGGILCCSVWLIYPVQANGRELYSLFNVCGTFVSSVSSIIVFYNFFRKEQLNKYIDWFFKEMGKMSIVIYLTPIILFPKGFMFEGLSFATENLVIVLIGIIHCLISYGIGKFIYTLPYLRFIMYGKK